MKTDNIQPARLKLNLNTGSSEDYLTILDKLGILYKTQMKFKESGEILEKQSLEKRATRFRQY